MEKTTKDSREVVLLHSNDIHSRLELAAKMATYIASERLQYGSDHVLTVDIGDHMDRMRVETEGSDGLVNISLLNEAGYEVATLGNNEGLTLTKEQLSEAYGKHAKFQMICANFYSHATSERPSWLAPSIILDKGSFRIGLIGVTASFSDFYNLLGWDVNDPFIEIAKQVADLRSKVDILIVMSHLGLAADRHIASSIEGIDLILGGHTHHLLEEPEYVSGTCICAAGKFGDYIGRVRISKDPVDAKLVFRAECVPIAGFEEKPAAVAIIEHFKTVADNRLSRVIAKLSEPLSTSIERESPLSNLLAAGLRSWMDAEIGIVNTGQLLSGLAAGEVTAGDIHALCPSPINPCRMRLKGKAIRQALEESLLEDYQYKPIRGFGFRGEVLGTLAVDGLEIYWNKKAEPLNKISAILVNGQPLEDEREYMVGTIDMFTFGVGYETIKSGTDTHYYLPEFIRDVLEKELQDSDSLLDCRYNRWLISDGEKPMTID